MITKLAPGGSGTSRRGASRSGGYGYPRYSGYLNRGRGEKRAGILLENTKQKK
jgi:hypothetical protein